MPTFHREDGGTKDLRNVGILQQHYKASQPWRPRFSLVPSSNGMNKQMYYIQLSISV